MPSQEDVARIASSLPGATPSETDSSFRINGRLFVWPWPERVDPKRPKVLSKEVVVVAVRDEMDKQTLLNSGNSAIFTEPHYDGWPDILLRLSDIDAELLERLIRDSYDIAVAKGPPKARRKG
jgi:hypothetical protein